MNTEFDTSCALGLAWDQIHVQNLRRKAEWYPPRHFSKGLGALRESSVGKRSLAAMAAEVRIGVHALEGPASLAGTPLRRLHAVVCAALGDGVASAGPAGSGSLASAPHDAALARLAKALHTAGDPDRHGSRLSQRLAAARALAAAGAAAAPHAGALAQALTGAEEWQVRSAAAKALGSICAIGLPSAPLPPPEEASLEALEPVAPPPLAAPEVRPVALQAVPAAAYPQPPSTEEAWPVAELVGCALTFAMAADSSDLVREAAAEALGHLSASHLERGLSDQAAADLRDALASALARTIQEERSWPVRAAAARALGRAGLATEGDDSAAALVVALRDAHWQVRWRAAEGLRAFAGSARCETAALVSALQHDSAWRVRREAAATLGTILGSAAAPPPAAAAPLTAAGAHRRPGLAQQRC